MERRWADDRVTRREGAGRLGQQRAPVLGVILWESRREGLIANGCGSPPPTPAPTILLVLCGGPQPGEADWIWGSPTCRLGSAHRAARCSP